MPLTLIRTSWTLPSILLALMIVLVAGPAAEAQGLKVGILHIGSIADGGYNQAHAEGIQAMKRNLPGVEVIEVENVPSENPRTGRLSYLSAIAMLRELGAPVHVGN